MEREAIYTERSPLVGFSQGTGPPLSQGIRYGNLLWLSGMGPLTPDTREVVSEDIEEQVRQTFDNIRAILEDNGSGMNCLVKVNAYLRRDEDFSRYNSAYRAYLEPYQPFPARTTMIAPAHRAGVNVEIEVVAFVPEA